VTDHPVLAHFPRLHGLVRRRHQCDFPELERALEQFEAELREALRHCHGQPQPRAAIITITATQEGNPMSSFAPGATITFTAASDNAVTISDAPVGDVTVTATDPAGLQGAVTVTVADQTPTTVTVTAA